MKTIKCVKFVHFGVQPIILLKVHILPWNSMVTKTATSIVQNIFFCASQERHDGA